MVIFSKHLLVNRNHYSCFFSHYFQLLFLSALFVFLLVTLCHSKYYLLTLIWVFCYNIDVLTNERQLLEADEATKKAKAIEAAKACKAGGDILKIHNSEKLWDSHLESKKALGVQIIVFELLLTIHNIVFHSNVLILLVLTILSFEITFIQIRQKRCPINFYFLCPDYSRTQICFKKYGLWKAFLGLTYVTRHCHSSPFYQFAWIGRDLLVKLSACFCSSILWQRFTLFDWFVIVNW